MTEDMEIGEHLFSCFIDCPEKKRFYKSERVRIGHVRRGNVK
jgi:hypothetical protein